MRQKYSMFTINTKTGLKMSPMLRELVIIEYYKDFSITMPKKFGWRKMSKE